ncbi:MAG: nucleotidyltransferase family protein [Pseudomonadota bacterium]
MAERRIFIAVLAAGSSRRFGEEDKLAASFRGKRLGEHVTSNIPLELAAPGCASVITSEFGHPCEQSWKEAGFGISPNPRANEGIGTSVARAVRLSVKAECDSILIALADMPFVPREHFVALINANLSTDGSFCSSSGDTRMPPAIFGPGFPHPMVALEGDAGMRPFLGQTAAVSCRPEWLVDIDTPEALRRLA